MLSLASPLVKLTLIQVTALSQTNSSPGSASHLGSTIAHLGQLSLHMLQYIIPNGNLVHSRIIAYAVSLIPHKKKLSGEFYLKSYLLELTTGGKQWGLIHGLCMMLGKTRAFSKWKWGLSDVSDVQSSKR